ncbi:MAG: molecular chaperone [Nitrospinae bacterium RIFCSPLOWO2_02_FULL_39_110]|nr:MAG: molecular chaperone [Nitrospinae bacterium RIFCSPHIGHO2_02_39_11]OGV99139.1 MAG: molecular chaperone [Nitrospinae bacterium RIFCSPHIGHO2_12_FULL_39_42]OGW02973.1 MAG: molecular chaperone [Nitrospinae bacterium RIFCSPHIGHO2_02_FULL_39_82]OGW05372.1 MAG: molecular chaperone [Nitrospinae bacterium RIFCSPLOWO2_02_FULL_39_110]OGW06622.1 MAG: molecular chaperone [Nitrospinae bacterium RIFCSPLOWO2_02_39_17]OGW10625.1 MAG: molecular chaperone [Nitrospinae bacterium RIFCSPLOWO2_12_FULL_39_93]O
MALVRWEPFKDLLSIHERMNRLFEDTLFRPRGMEEELAKGTWAPAVDIYETQNDIVLKAELPGLTQKDINVEVRDNTLILKGEKKFEKEVKEENYHRIERSYGSFQRMFTLPDTIQQDKVKAKFKEGVLEIVMPKEEKAKPKLVKVDVE